MASVQFSQAVGGFIQQAWACVLDLVPFFKDRLVLDTEIRRQVDHLDAGRQQRRRLGHGHAVRGGEEHHVALAQVGLVGRREGDVHAAAQRREHIGNRQAIFLARRDSRQLHIRVDCQQSQQFHSGISGAADDANFDHVLSLNEVMRRRDCHFIRHLRQTRDVPLRARQIAKKPPDTRPAAFLRARRKQRATA